MSARGAERRTRVRSRPLTHRCGSPQGLESGGPRSAPGFCAQAPPAAVPMATGARPRSRPRPQQARLRGAARGRAGAASCGQVAARAGGGSRVGCAVAAGSGRGAGQPCTPGPWSGHGGRAAGGRGVRRRERAAKFLLSRGPGRKSWQSWPERRLGPSGSPCPTQLRVCAEEGESLVWEPKALSPKTWEWILREDPAPGNRRIPRRPGWRLRSRSQGRTER